MTESLFFDRPITYLKTYLRCIVAPYEADSQLAFLSRNNIVDAVLTEDSDLFIFEANTGSFQNDTH